MVIRRGEMVRILLVCSSPENLLKTTYSTDICQYFLKVMYDWNVNKKTVMKFIFIEL